MSRRLIQHSLKIFIGLVLGLMLLSSCSILNKKAAWGGETSVLGVPSFKPIQNPSELPQGPPYVEPPSYPPE